jgi:hypothetical protein
MNDTRDTLTPEEVGEIERRAEDKSGPAPWEWGAEYGTGGYDGLKDAAGEYILEGLHDGSVSVCAADAEYITLACNSLPRLCASLRAAWAERDEAWEEVEDVVAEAREIKDAQDALLAERDALRAEVKRLRGLPTVGARTGLPLPPFPALVEPCPICNDRLYPEECGESHGKPASEGPEPCTACGTPDGNTCDCLG